MCCSVWLLTDKTEKAAQELGLDYELEKVEDLESMMALGVMATPALVVDGRVKLSGFVPHVSKIKELLGQS